MMLAVFALLLASVAAPSVNGSKSVAESDGGLLAASGIDGATTQSMNSRGFDLLKRIVDADKNRNILISPYSIDSAFGLVIPGARDETRKGILDALGLPSNSSEVLHALDTSLTSAREARVLTSNSVWLQQGLELFPAYRNEIERFFSGMVRQVDFAGDPDNAANTINKYVSKKTAGMIPEIVKAKSFSGSNLAVLVLVNTLYFKCDWAQKFDKKQTQSEEFKCSDGKIIPVEMMNSTFTVPYGENDVARQIRLGYKDDRFSMYVILPKAGKSIQDVLAGLICCGVADFGLKMERKEIKISIPKLDVEFERDIKDDLGKAAKALFRGIVCNEELFVDKVLHKTKLIADEESTEAAAATAVTMVAKCWRPPPMSFRADCPFVIVLHDRTTGLALFAGVVGAPKKTNRPPVIKYVEGSAGATSANAVTKPLKPLQMFDMDF